MMARMLVSGMDVDKVHLTPDQLDIEGRRAGLEYGKDGPPRRVRYGGKVRIHIQAHPGDDLGPALAAVFAPDLASLIPSDDQYWATIGDHFT